jgi:hypothetical protein
VPPDGVVHSLAHAYPRRTRSIPVVPSSSASGSASWAPKQSWRPLPRRNSCRRRRDVRAPLYTDEMAVPALSAFNFLYAQLSELGDLAAAAARSKAAEFDCVLAVDDGGGRCVQLWREPCLSGVHVSVEVGRKCIGGLFSCPKCMAGWSLQLALKNVFLNSK